ERSCYFTAQTLQRIAALAGFQPIRGAESRRDGSVQLLAQLSDKPQVRDEWRNNPADVRSSVLRNQLSYHAGPRHVRNKIHRPRLNTWAPNPHAHLISPAEPDTLPAFQRAA